MYAEHRPARMVFAGIVTIAATLASVAVRDVGAFDPARPPAEVVATWEHGMQVLPGSAT